MNYKNLFTEPKNVININENAKYSDEECQEIKNKWKKYCECLNSAKICIKEQKACINTFDNYYICQINDKIN